jgi:hypothetical protein
MPMTRKLLPDAEELTASYFVSVVEQSSPQKLTELLAIFSLWHSYPPWPCTVPADLLTALSPRGIIPSEDAQCLVKRLAQCDVA